MKEKNKTLIIGIDGGTFKVIKPLIERGELPNIEKLMESGAWGELESTIPPVTCPAWPSFMTGLKPKNHRVYDWFHYNKDYSKDIKNFLSIRGKKYWDYLSEKGLSCIVINMPLTYPPQKLKGIIVSGFLTPSMEKEFTYPKKIKKDLLKKDYRIEPEGIRSVSDNKFFKSVIKTIDRRKDAAIDLMESKWDVLTVVFNLSDATQHRFWKEGKMDRIYKVYKRIDKSIGEIIKKAENPRIIIMSDHGFGRVAKINFYLNSWLRKNNYLKLKSGKNYAKNFEKIYIFLRKFGLDKLKYLILNKFDKIRKPGEANIKWGKTRAWGRTEDDTCLVYINKEYFEKSTVKKEDYEKVRENLINNIKEIKHSGTGEKIVNHIWKKEELYDEDEEAPDIIFKIKQKYKGKDTFESRVFIDIPKKARIGWHTSKGIFIAFGPNIKNKKLDGAKLIDVAPTILAMYGTKGEMDGKILDIFKKKPRIKEERKNKKEKKEDKNVFNNKDKEKIKERLKALGYM